MTIEEKSKLKEAGIQLEDAMARFLGNEEMYKKFLVKFLSDDNFIRMKEQLEKNNCKESFKCAHTIKGLAGNLSMSELYLAMTSFVEYLRNDNLQEAKEQLEEVEKIYLTTAEQIKNAIQ